MPITLVSSVSGLPAPGFLPEGAGLSADSPLDFSSVLFSQLFAAETLPGMGGVKREETPDAPLLLTDELEKSDESSVGDPLAWAETALPDFILPTPQTPVGEGADNLSVSGGAPPVLFDASATGVETPTEGGGLAASAQPVPVSAAGRADAAVPFAPREREDGTAAAASQDGEAIVRAMAGKTSDSAAAPARFSSSAKIADAPSAPSLSALSAPSPQNPAAANPAAVHTAALPAAAPDVSPARTTLASPVGSPNWGNDLGQKIVWFAKNDTQSAQILLNPPQAGPIEVSLNVSRNTANAFFVSANPDIRESIEAALPRLREMFAEVGIELGQAQVSAESFRQEAQNGEANASRWTTEKAILADTAPVSSRESENRVRSRDGLVDIFA